MRAQSLRKSGLFAIIAAILIAAPFGASVGATDLVEERLEPRKTGSSDCATDDIPRRLGHQSGLFGFTEEPEGGTWQTWFVSPDELEVPPPPASGSPQDLLELAEVRLAVLNRTSEQALLSELYGQNPAGAYWTGLYLNLIVLHADKDASKNPPRLARQMAIFETALYDAFVAVWHYKYCYLRAAPSVLDPTIDTVVDVPAAPSYPSEHAAAVGVIAAIFPAFFPCPDPNNNQTCEERPEFWDQLAHDGTESRIWAGANYRSDIEVGYAIGHEIGARVLEARDADGWKAQWDGTGWLEGDCNWKRNPLGHGGRGPVEVMWGKVTPFAMTHGGQFRAPPPPACDSPSYIAQYQDLFDASLTLTQRQADISDFWEAGPGTVTPPGMNLEIALKKTLEYELNTLRAQRVLAYVSVAVADAAIAAWDTKFTYWWDRPIQAIRRLGLDVAAGLCEDGVQEDYIYGGCWESRAVTPPFPGYISGHSTFTGAGMETLKYFFPDDWLEFNACQTEAAMARFYGGIHFRADNDVGIEVGRQIGHLLWERAANDGADE